jgi:sugar phosphate isomerase/epimerase
MRLGAPVFNFKTPEEWAAAHARKGLGAAYWPLGVDAPAAERDAFVRAAANQKLVIAEVGVWNNLLDPDPAKREANIQTSIAKLRLADVVGARCCVNISGSHSAQWDGPHPQNLTPETFDAVVRTTRRILDGAAPVNTFYTLECMPWMFPHDLDSMQRLLNAVGHPRFAVHLDMCNLMNMPEKVWRNAEHTRAWFAALGPRIRSIHAKDVLLHGRMTTHIDEVLPGRGQFDYAELLRCAHAQDDVPVMCEHLSTEAEYDEAVAHLQKVAASIGLTFTAS